MSVNYAAGLKNTRMNDVKNAIDAGGAAGKVNIYTSGYATLLVSIPLAYPGSSVTGAVLNLLGTPRTGTGAANGVAAIAKVLTSADVVVADGLTVGLTSADIILDNVNIASGQTVNLNSGSITHG